MTYMLIDEEDGNVLPLLREAIECLLYGRVFRFGVDNKEILLCIRRFGDVLGTNILALGG